MRIAAKRSNDMKISNGLRRIFIWACSRVFPNGSAMVAESPKSEFIFIIVEKQKPLSVLISSAGFGHAGGGFGHVQAEL